MFARTVQNMSSQGPKVLAEIARRVFVFAPWRAKAGSSDTPGCVPHLDMPLKLHCARILAKVARSAWAEELGCCAMRSSLQKGVSMPESVRTSIDVSIKGETHYER